MSIPDSALPQWWSLALDRDAPGGDPMESKLALARGIVARYHGEEAAARGEEHFTRVVREGRAPEEIPEWPLPPDEPVHLPKLLADAGLVPSTSEGRRLIGQGGLKLNGEVVAELDASRERLNHAVLQAGKRRFLRLTDAS
jgi:tyrosyl-tRNA synthetase